MTIPYSVLTGTFYDATGEARANQVVVFEPQSTPYAAGSILVLSTPIRVTLTALGSLPLNFELAAGGYRVVADASDAFFITVPGDGATLSLASLVTLNEVTTGSSLRALTAAQLQGAIVASTSVGVSVLGETQTVPFGMVFFGNAGAIGQEAIGGVDTFVKSLSPQAVAVLGGGNPGAAPADWDDNVGSFLAPWIPNYMGNYGPGSPGAATRDAAYVLGSADWYNGTTTDVLAYFTGTGVCPARYYRKTFAAGTLYSVDLFCLSTASTEPDGRGSTETQALWLQSQLAASTARWKLVLLNEVPYCSVTGAETTVLRWPLAAWGADAVLGAGPAVYERLAVDGLPYFVLGRANSVPAEFGTTSPYSLVRYAERRTVLLVKATEAKLSFRAVPVGGELLVDTLDLEAPTTPFMRFFAKASTTGGLRVGTEGLEMNWPVTAFNQGAALNVQQLAQPAFGVIQRRTTLPSIEEVAEAPQWRNTWVQIGDDPPLVYYWNSVAGAWHELVLTDPAAPYQTGITKLQTSTPTLTAASTGVQGVLVAHATPGAVQVWYSWNGAAFQQLLAWPDQAFVGLPLNSVGEQVFAAYCTTVDDSKTPSQVVTLVVKPA